MCGDAVFAPPPASYEAATAQPNALSVYRWPAGTATLYRVVRLVLTSLSFVGVAEFLRSYCVLNSMYQCMDMNNLLEINIPQQQIFANSKGGLIIEGGVILTVPYLKTKQTRK